jgi:putative acetyltransferase
MEVRPYRDSDFEQLISGWRAASVVAHPFLTPDFLDAEVESIREVYLAAADSWVAEVDGEVVGFLALLGSEIGAVFVHPNHWRAGIGSALMNQATKSTPRLHLDVFAENKIGRAFYKRYGFVEGDRGVHQATGEKIIRMEYVGSQESKHQSS